MKYTYILAALVICQFCDSALAAFPTEINKCKPGDGECIKQIINFIFHKRGSEGIPGLNLVPLDPLVIKSVEISQGASSPVNVNLKFRNSDFSGVPSVGVTKVTGFGKDLTGPHTIYVGGGHVTLAGKYEVSGRVLLLPINGAGDSNITLVNPDFKFQFHGKPYEKKGKTYMKVDDLKLEGEISRLHIFLGNLFNGDRALGDNMNAFLNENWQDIFHELKPKIYEAFGLIFQAVINNVFAKYPYAEMFAE